MIGVTLAAVLLADGTAVALHGRPSPAAVTAARAATSDAGPASPSAAVSEPGGPLRPARSSGRAAALPPAAPTGSAVSPEQPPGPPAAREGGAPSTADPTYTAPGGDVVRGPVPPPAGAYGLAVGGSATATVAGHTCDVRPPSSATSSAGQSAGSSTATIAPATPGAEPSYTASYSVPLAGGAARLTWRLRYTPTLTLVDVVRVDLTCGAARSLALRLSPARLAFPLNLEPGEEWEGRGAAGGTTTTTSSRVTGPDSVKVGSATYGTYVVDTTQVWSGQISGRVHERWWVSPELGVPLRLELADALTGPDASWTTELTIAVTSVPVKKATAGP